MGGLFVSDPNKSFGGRLWETISRFSYQLPQTIGGFASAQATNTYGFGGGVESVRYLYGATVIKTRGRWGAIAQGSFVIGDNRIEANPHNWLFQHEYGHYIQSQSMGWAYYSRVGIPSSRSTGIHDFHPVEQDANRRAFLYFHKNIEGFYDVNPDDNKGWNFFKNPLDMNGSQTEGQLVDYNNPAHLLALGRLVVRAKWYDHASWILPLGGPIWIGLINSRNLNRKNKKHENNTYYNYGGGAIIQQM